MSAERVHGRGGNNPHVQGSTFSWPVRDPAAPPAPRFSFPINDQGSRAGTVNVELVLASQEKGISNSAISDAIGDIHNEILADRHMRHPPFVDLLRSYEQNMAAVLIDRDTGLGVGYVRLVERMGSDLREALAKERVALPEDLPRVVEYGSAFVVQGYQGHSFSTLLSNEVLRPHAQAINDGEMVVVGLTNNWQVIRATAHAEEVGIEFNYETVSAFHLIYPTLTPLFCNCHFGEGAQNMIKVPGCTIGEPREILTTPTPDKTPEFDENGTMPFYTVFFTHPTHSQSLEERMKDQLAQLFVGLDQPRSVLLADALRRAGYFDEQAQGGI